MDRRGAPAADTMPGMDVDGFVRDGYTVVRGAFDRSDELILRQDRQGRQDAQRNPDNIGSLGASVAGAMGRRQAGA